MYSLLFFLSDFVIYDLIQDWIVHALLIHFIVINFRGQKQAQRGIAGTTLLPFFLLLLEDTFLYGRFGLGLWYLIPTFILCKWSSIVFSPRVKVIPYIILVISLLTESLVVKKLILAKNSGVESTLPVILLNVMIMFFYSFLYSFLQGTRGNRIHSS